MEPFRTQEEKTLLAILARHGASAAWVPAPAAWSAFKEFGRSIELHGGTGLLFQVGTFDFDGRELFYFDAVCQLEDFAEDDEQGAFEQLHCELTCPPTVALEALEANLWSFDFSDVDAFYAAVEGLPAFQAAAQQGNYRLKVWRGGV